MLQAFIIVSRETLESFFIVAIILSYLKRSERRDLMPAAYAGIFTSLILSAGLGFLFMQVANRSLWEGVLGVLAVFMVTSLVVHMWRVGPQMKHQMETRLSQFSSTESSSAIGVFVFTVFMITREGMETALMLFEVKQGRFIIGAIFGLLFATVVSWLWTRANHHLNLKRFFKTTAVFLLLFVIQIAIYSFHELCEAGIFPKSEYWHALTEPYSPDGRYGKWFSFFSVGFVLVWLVGATLADRWKRQKISPPQ